MSSKLFRAVNAALFAAILLLCAAQPAVAIPIFAQRYGLSCKDCHTVFPELNAFGTAFRNRGYRFPEGVPRHGTTVAAIRYNMVYARDPVPGTRRFTPSASILADQDFGAINAFLHYNLGAGGGPSQPFLGFLSYYGARIGTLFRAGLYELPLKHSPEQRIDDVSPYGYESLTVGQNDLALNAPRLGLETEHLFGATRVATSLAFGEFKGAAYGGAPIDDGTHTVAAGPEFGLFARGPLRRGLDLGAEYLAGTRSIALPGRAPARDPYQRLGLGASAVFFRKRSLDLELQQWIGYDANADARGDGIGSSGGYALLKYFVTPHLYLGARYDTQAAPIAARDAVLYVGTFLTPHVHLVLERRNDLVRGTPTLEGEVIIGAPWPAHL